MHVSEQDEQKTAHAPKAPDPGTRRRPKEPRGRWLRAAWPPALLLAVVAALWEFLPGLLDIKEFVLPPLSKILARFGSPSFLQQVWSNGLVTLKETLLGLLLGAV